MIDHTPTDPRIFVFGSNLQGIHGAGAAKYAHRSLGATWGQIYGPMGHAGFFRCFAIPTCSVPGVPLVLGEISKYVDCFFDFARTWDLTPGNQRFYISKIGCGFAGYSEAQIAPLFAGAPKNCDLPEGWR